MSTQRILIIGGTGVFGKRLVRHLSGFAGIELYVSSRSQAKAEAVIESLGSQTIGVHGVALDCKVNLQERLAQIGPYIVVDCTGPFQSANYDTARAVLAAGAHFIDLADARDYLANFAQALDGLAKENNVSALAGASSTPTLSACVVDHLAQDFQRIDTIDICITPGGKSEVGRSVIEAIMSYTGQKIPIWRAGTLSETMGWGDAKSVEIPNLGPRRVAAVETFDAEHLGVKHNVQSRVAFSAGLESRVEQLGIELIAALRSRGLCPDPKLFIALLLKARNITRIPTSNEGGMLVEMSGLNAQGIPVCASWSLIAKRDHGPFIPILPAAAAIKALCDTTLPSGAGLAYRAVSLSDILAQMEAHDIATQSSTQSLETSVFEHALGQDAFNALPKALRAFHKVDAPPVWAGVATIASGSNPIAKLISKVFGFPTSGQDVPVTISVDRYLHRSGKPVERWARDFHGVKMSSILQVDDAAILTESFGPFKFTLPATSDQVGLRMPVGSWQFARLPLPKWLAPRSDAVEYMDDAGRFCFDVKLSLPVFGVLSHYRGWLTPQE